MLLYIYPERVDIPEQERDCHSSLGSSGDISIPPRQLRSPSVPIQSDNRYASTPDSSGLCGLPSRTPLRSYPSLPTGSTSPSDILSCAAPAHLRTTLISSLTSHNTIRHGFHFLHTEHFLHIKISSKLNSGYKWSYSRLPDCPVSPLEAATHKGSNHSWQPTRQLSHLRRKETPGFQA